MDERYRVLKNSSEVSELKGLAFEEYLAQLFHDLGYKTTKTTASGDFGADVLLHDGDRKIVVQAKQYTSSVGFEAVKEAYFALGYYAADEAWVVTTSSFTHQAINAAGKTGVKLISGSELDVLIARARNTASNSSPNKQATEKTKPKTAEPSGVEATARRAAGCSIENGIFVLCGKRSAVSCRVLTSYTGNSSIVETPMGVDAIGEASFSNCSLRKIVIHEGVKHIGDGAFSSCKNLETVQLPSTLVTIGDDAFLDCCRLESIQLPAALASIGDRAFLNCSRLKEIVLTDGLRSIGESAFENSGITALSLPKSLETIGARAFAESALVTADLDSNIDEIPEGAFCACIRLSKIALPHGVKRIGESAFSLAAISSIDFPNSLEDICHDAFSFCGSLRIAPLPDGVKNVCRSAFSGCSSIEDPDLDDVFYAPVIVRDTSVPTQMTAEEPDPDVEQIISERDSLFRIDYDFTIGDFVISANEEGLASYALCDDDEFGNRYQGTKTITSVNPIIITVRRGTYLYLSHATASRLVGPPAYMKDVAEFYGSAIRLYEQERFKECKDSVFHALITMEANDEAYSGFRDWESERSIMMKLKSAEDAEAELALSFGLRSGLDLLLLSKLQVLDDCMTCRTPKSYYDPNVKLFKTVNRILDFRIGKSPTNVQAEFCEFAYRLVYENSMFAYERAEQKIRRHLSKNDEWGANFEKKCLDESKENFKAVLLKIVQRTVALSKSPDFDVRFLSFIYRILGSQEKEILGEKDTSSLDEYLTTTLRTRCGDEYQMRLQQFISEHSRQIDMLDDRRSEVRSSHAGLSFISPSKMMQRRTALKEIDDKKATLKNELNHAESIVVDMLWKSLEHKHLDRSIQ